MNVNRKISWSWINRALYNEKNKLNLFDGLLSAASQTTNKQLRQSTKQKILHGFVYSLAAGKYSNVMVYAATKLDIMRGENIAAAVQEPCHKHDRGVEIQVFQKQTADCVALDESSPNK